jgi:hypothetical protein
VGEVVNVMAKETVDRIRAGSDDEVMSRSRSFESFFAGTRYEFPLSSQMKSVEGKGFPPVPAQVLSLLVAETATGVLMGVQDASRIVGHIELDVLEAPDSFQGMRGEIRCGAGEIVVRDGISIVASYFQGPDKRTAVTRKSTELLYYVFSTPARPDCVSTGVAWLTELLSLCCDGVASTIVPTSDKATGKGTG